VLYSDFANIMASCVAIARTFPLFSQKTTNSGYGSVEIELVIPNGDDKVIIFLFKNYLIDSEFL
jgi:hypothetical protein